MTATGPAVMEVDSAALLPQMTDTDDRDALRWAQEAADVAEALRLLRKGASDRHLLMLVGPEDEADSEASTDFLAAVRRAAEAASQDFNAMD